VYFDFKVDVIIPNYNQTILLSRAIDSVLIQGDVVNKIFIVDDGSDEETTEYLQTHFFNIGKIETIRSSRKSHPGVMRDIGLEHSSSEWIAFLDSDDFWEPGKIEKQLKFALEGDFQVVCTNAYICNNLVKGRGMYQFNSEPKITTKSLIKENIIINSSSLVRKDCFEKIGGYPREYYLRGVEDYSTWLRLSVHFKIGFLNEFLVNYEDIENSFGKQQNSNLRNIALFDFAFWSKRKTSFSVRLYLKYYLCRILGRK
jgi:glycosyltransferase involved in cell wall biosynthesis